MNEFYIGLMSGTSLDGVDGVLVDFGPAASPQPLRVLAHVAQPFDANFRAELLALNSPGTDELHRASLAANRLARCYAAVVQQLLAEGCVERSAVLAIGAHGQTVRHRPGEFDGTGYTIQLHQPALLAELTRIPVASDFRSRDVAAGGHGAPLAPAFHEAIFASADRAVGVLNVGGISNITLLAPGTDTLGFDCGPGNALMDLWCNRHLGQAYDDGGRWAASGTLVPGLLASLMSQPWLSLPPPKSTGRDLFNEAWLQRHLADFPAAPADVQATLCEFTALACAQHLQRHAPGLGELIVCGGGAFNHHLLSRLAHHLPGTRVLDSVQRGLPPLQVEAAAFAWLARRRVLQQPGNLPSVTGAAGPRVLGSLYTA